VDVASPFFLSDAVTARVGIGIGIGIGIENDLEHAFRTRTRTRTADSRNSLQSPWIRGGDVLIAL
jgi:hypothetical protein